MIKIFKVFSLLCTVFISAQATVAVKTNLLFPTGNPSWKNISSSATQAYESSGKNSVGFNAGLSLKVNLVKALFLMPEIYYMNIKSEFIDPVTNTKLEAKNQRADLPVLVGINLLNGHFGVFIGPVASYNLSKENQYNDFVENARDQFTLGYQFGAQITLSKLIFTGRYEGAFTTGQRDFINKNTNMTIRYDNRPSYFLAGVGYKF